MEQKLCKYCGAPSHYSKKYKRFQPYCLECKNTYIKEKREKTMKEKYGVSNASHLESRKEVMKRVNKIRKEKFAKGELQTWTKGLTKESDPRIASLAKKGSETKKKRFAKGELEVWNKGLTKETDERLASLSESLKKSWEERELSDLQKEHLENLKIISSERERTKEEYEKQKQTNLKRHGVSSYLCLVQNKGLEKQKEIYGSVFLGSKEYENRKDEMFAKMRETNLKKYGVESVLANRDIIKKIQESKRKNNSFHVSKEERKSVKLIQERVQTVFVQYSDERYPYSCDLYLPKSDLFIELNYHWTHGFEPFVGSEKQKKILKEWEDKAKESRYYQIAIEVWTERDIEKRELAKLNKLNYKEFFNYQEFNEFVDSLEKEEMKYPYRNLIYTNNVDYERRFKRLCNSIYSYSSRAFYNDLILPFVWEIFYKKEIELWKDYKIRKKLIQNRIQYLHKVQDEITDLEILRGFSKSLIHKGFSSFSPFTIKNFIKNYNITSIYDPCGGWGHRLLGAWNIDYWYNDYNKELTNKIEEMFLFYNKFKSSNKYFSYEDASTFLPSRKFDATFTCPPYFDIEDYDFNGDSSSVYPDYNEWLNVWWRGVVKNSFKVSDIFAFVISRKLLNDMSNVLKEEGFVFVKEEIITQVKKNHLSKSSEEVLSIWKKTV